MLWLVGWWVFIRWLLCCVGFLLVVCVVMLCSLVIWLVFRFFLGFSFSSCFMFWLFIVCWGLLWLWRMWNWLWLICILCCWVFLVLVGDLWGFCVFLLGMWLILLLIVWSCCSWWSLLVCGFLFISFVVLVWVVGFVVYCVWLSIILGSWLLCWWLVVWMCWVNVCCSGFCNIDKVVLWLGWIGWIFYRGLIWGCVWCLYWLGRICISVLLVLWSLLVWWFMWVFGWLWCLFWCVWVVWFSRRLLWVWILCLFIGLLIGLIGSIWGRMLNWCGWDCFGRFGLIIVIVWWLMLLLVVWVFSVSWVWWVLVWCWLLLFCCSNLCVCCSVWVYSLCLLWVLGWIVSWIVIGVWGMDVCWIMVMMLVLGLMLYGKRKFVWDLWCYWVEFLELELLLIGGWVVEVVLVGVVLWGVVCKVVLVVLCVCMNFFLKLKVLWVVDIVIIILMFELVFFS